MSAYSDQAVELTLTHIPPSFRRSRSTSHMFSAPLLHLSTRTYRIIVLVQPLTLLRRRRDCSTRDLCDYVYLGGSAASFSTAAAPSTKKPKPTKYTLDPERFPRPTSRALQPQYLAVHRRVSRRRRCAPSSHLTRRRTRVRRRQWRIARQEG